MDRRQIIALLGGTILASPLEVRAQQPGRTYRLGFLSGVYAIRRNLTHFLTSSGGRALSRVKI
jgi:hypothetical protein